MSTPLSSALIISNDTSVVEAIVSNNKSEKVFNARASVQEALSEPGLLENNSIVILDIATTNNDVDLSIDQAIKLKQADPTQVLIIVGDKDPLNDILKSHIQPMVYRAFNKPVNPNQMFLSFKSAEILHDELKAKKAAGEDILVIGPQENKTTIESIAEERKTNPLIFVAAGVAVVGILAFLFIGGDDASVNTSEVTQITEPVNTIETQESELNKKLNELNQLASTALLDGRYIAPKGNNALAYYDQALAIDPYDAVAYEGRKSVAASLRKSYDSLMIKGDFNQALTVVNALSEIEPLNPENEKLQAQLQKALIVATEKERIAGETSDSAAKAELLAKIESSKKASSSASNARKAEQSLIRQIKNALSSNNLVPPTQNNAYSLLSSGLKSNKISKANATPLIKSLSSQLLDRANAAFARGDLNETNRLMSSINRVDSNSSGLATLRKKVNARKIAIAQNNNDAAVAAAQVRKKEEERKAREAARIVPAKIISRSTPRYPYNAQKKGIEGWVQVQFIVDTEGNPKNVIVEASSPKDVFDSAALKSVKKWYFSPSRNQETGQPVDSKPISTTLQFKLEDS